MGTRTRLRCWLRFSALLGIAHALGCGVPEETRFGEPDAITRIRLPTKKEPPTEAKCKAVQSFVANAIPGMASCAGCHGAAVNPKFLADATTNADAACAKTLAYINKADVASSRLFTAAAGTNHSVQTIDMDAVTKWAEAEK